MPEPEPALANAASHLLSLPTLVIPSAPPSTDTTSVNDLFKVLF